MENICVSAIILSAGQSRRMGQSKMNLAWGQTTVLGQVVKTLDRAAISDILIVTGSIPLAIFDQQFRAEIRYTPNVGSETADMLGSIQSGLQYLLADRTVSCKRAALVALGDMPEIPLEVVNSVIEAWKVRGASIIVPSYQMRRGHPWLVDQSLWQEILSLAYPLTMRNFLNKHTQEIEYVVSNHPGILVDIDTPEDYQRNRPENR